MQAKRRVYNMIATDKWGPGGKRLLTPYLHYPIQVVILSPGPKSGYCVVDKLEDNLDVLNYYLFLIDNLGNIRIQSSSA